MADFSFILGIIGNVISILMFASPIGTFRRVVKKRSTEEYKGIPYIITLLSTSLWTFYGLLKPGGLLVVTVNGTGTILHIIYVTLFLIYAPGDTKMQSLKLVAILNIGFLGSVIAVTFLAFHGKLLFVGVICAALTIGMYASPLSAMRTVVKTRSVEYMPFFLSFFQFLNGGVWAAYSALVKDYFIGVPNAIGFALGSAQLMLYLMYKDKTPTSKPKDTDEEEEEGSAHLVKGRVQMQNLGDDIEAQSTNHSTSSNKLSKGRSLPIPSSRQLSFQRLGKTTSLNPNELLSILASENGNKV